MEDTKPPTIGERIAVHLAQYVRHREDFVCPPGMAQSGIAESLGITRAHTAIELKRAIESGRVVVRVAHVAGEPSRRKVYHLTPKGEWIARTVRDRALRRTLELVSPSGRPEVVPGVRAFEVLRAHGVGEGRAVLLMLTRTRIDLRNPSLRHPAKAAPRRMSEEERARVWFDRTFWQPIAWQFEVVQGPPRAPPVPAAA
ncbi:MAG: hypothetical protein E6K18_03015 [Methanobacteriota archaeon]|nr:MAG: hypothetical protein E6K18_03015 [Euryarchaeota archaeon]